jgi:hypothetical protein
MTIYNRFVRRARLPCADSRVPLLLAALGVGELFVARNDRNMAETANGDYRIRHRAPRRSVRRRCGAVSVACEVVEQHAKFPHRRAVYGKRGDFIDNTVRESAKPPPRRRPRR